ncbi:unnamed protein product [Vitrella brassicaformis CCMP3155]|uniref:Uncharacterized protein n=1 Tax=Vitrella brassicaformis (strain CCMP3155) TaxID=1169540 RepID=A0A0G4GXE8_VITBC|nr:unnamed protein product [Vitrella brassicaformis CCMP3155]|eukprot:CEM35753.1 unnamed protein product [Vitrella brassicaformis CCMP3155]
MMVSSSFVVVLTVVLLAGSAVAIPEAAFLGQHEQETTTPAPESAPCPGEVTRINGSIDGVLGTEQFGPFTYASGDVAPFLIVALDAVVGDMGLVVYDADDGEIDESFSAFTFKESDTPANYEHAVKVNTADFGGQDGVIVVVICLAKTCQFDLLVFEHTGFCEPQLKPGETITGVCTSIALFVPTLDVPPSLEGEPLATIQSRPAKTKALSTKLNMKKPKASARREVEGLFGCPLLTALLEDSEPNNATGNPTANIVQNGTDQSLLVDLPFALASGFPQVVVAANSVQGNANLIAAVDDEPFGVSENPSGEADAVYEDALIVPTDAGSKLEVFVTAADGEDANAEVVVLLFDGACTVPFEITPVDVPTVPVSDGGGAER